MSRSRRIVARLCLLQLGRRQVGWQQYKCQHAVVAYQVPILPGARSTSSSTDGGTHDARSGGHTPRSRSNRSGGVIIIVVNKDDHGGGSTRSHYGGTRATRTAARRADYIFLLTVTSTSSSSSSSSSRSSYNGSSDAMSRQPGCAQRQRKVTRKASLRSNLGIVIPGMVIRLCRV